MMKHRKFPLAPRPALLLAFVAAAAQAREAHGLCNPKRPRRVKMRAFFSCAAAANPNHSRLRSVGRTEAGGYGRAPSVPSVIRKFSSQSLPGSS
jgi:hypothetical protein